MDYTLISADSHVIEPRDLFVEQLPEQYRDRAPRVVRGRDGGDGWSFDGNPPARTFGLEAVAGQKAVGEKFAAEGLTWDEILPGNYDGAAHVADMDRDGVDASVLYSGPRLRARRDAHLQRLAARRLLWCGPRPSRRAGAAADRRRRRRHARRVRALRREGSEGLQPPRITRARVLRRVLRPALERGVRGRHSAVVPSEPRWATQGRHGGVPARHPRRQRGWHRRALLHGDRPVHLHDLHRRVRTVSEPEVHRRRSQLRVAPVLAREHGSELRAATRLGKSADRAPAE